MDKKTLKHPLFVALALMTLSAIGFLIKYYFFKDSPDHSEGQNIQNVSFTGAHVNNYGNIANVQNSTNTTVNQSIINPLPNPVILQTQCYSINIQDLSSRTNSTYKTQFILVIGYPGDALRFYYKSPSSLIAQPKIESAGAGERAYASGVIPYKKYLITFLTLKRVQESDFGPFLVKQK